MLFLLLFLCLFFGVLLFLGILVFILRKILRLKKVKKFFKEWSQWSNTKKTIRLWQNTIVIVLSFCFSLFCFLIFITSLKLHFVMPKTDAINWYTVHHYPRQQDTFYFVTAFTFITASTAILWFIWIYLIKRK
jgi:hypothetical protein